MPGIALAKPGSEHSESKDARHETVITNILRWYFMIKQNKQGYILVLVLTILALCTVLVSQIVNRSISQRSLAKISSDREHAKSLALSGLQIALSKITQEKAKSEEKGQADKAAPAKDNTGKWLIQIFTNINYWHTYELKDEVDGINGKIELYISPEQGKINLNQLYDKAKKQFVTIDKLNAKEIIKWVDEKLQTITKKPVAEKLEKLLKEKEPILDVTELLNLDEFKGLSNIFLPKPEDKSEQTKKGYIQDVFTVESGNLQLNPWLLSNSILSLIGGKPRSALTDEQKKELEEKLKNVSPTPNWATDWNKYLAPTYGVEWNSINNNIKSLFSTKFDPAVFSVISYGTVNDITQKVLAVIKKDSSAQDKQVKFSIKKIYWLN